MRNALHKRLGNFLNIFKSRIFIFGLVCVVFVAILVVRLFNLQIVNGEEYLNSFTYRIQKNVEIEAPRGTIYDCNGVALAYNKLSYSIVIGDSPSLIDNDTRNAMVQTLIEYAAETGDELNYDIPLELDDNGNVIFNAGESTVTQFKKDVYSTTELTDEQKNATAQEVYEYMRSSSLFDLDESIDDQTALQILSIRFDVYLNRYAQYMSVSVADDISDSLVAKIKENQDSLPGVSIEEGYTRVYKDSEVFSNITGYIGQISEDEYNEKVESGDNGYTLNDKIGKTGIEQYCEDTLKGQNGSQVYYVNSMGSIIEETDKVDPVPGNDVYLSIDAEYQKNCYEKLEARVAGILLYYYSGGYDDNMHDYSLTPNDVYFALLDNNVISIDDLSADDATDREKDFWQKYKDYEADMFPDLENEMDTERSSLSSEYSDYIDLAITMLKDEEVINATSLDDDETLSNAWDEKTISFHQLIRDCASKGYINVDNLNVDSSYVDSDEIYTAVVSYLEEELPLYLDFQKSVYHNMLENETISGEEICLLLYDQGVLDAEDDEDYEALASGSMSAYSFMYDKIYNLEITPDMLALAPCAGSFVMTDVDTGKVIALVSYPSYDANRITDSDYYSSLLNNGSSPLLNRPTQQKTAPGSTYKPLVAVAGLEEGVITEDTYITDQVVFNYVSPPARCWSSVGHGSVNVETAIEYSCNYFFYSVGFMLGKNSSGVYDSELGIEKLKKYASMFGLDEVTGLELPESEPEISDTDAVRSAIGQGSNNYTPAQLCRYITAIANRGNLYQLSVLDHAEDSSGNTVETYDPVLTRTLDVKSSTFDLVQNGMYLVCNGEVPEQMGGLPVTLAGKSGSAEQSDQYPEHGLFVGYAPYDDPEVAATVVIPYASGSQNVLALYADLMCDYFHVEYPYSYDDSGNGTHATLVSGGVSTD